MRTIFKTAGAILAAGVILAACGQSTSNTSGTGSSSTGATPSSAKVTLPHGNTPTPSIAALMKIDKPFAKQIVNKKYWVKSSTFGRYIFVGPYTSGVNRKRVRDTKIAAMDAIELLVASSNYQPTWPTVLNGFNYQTFGQAAISQANLTALNRSAVSLGHHSMIADVPSEATIIESPVGKLTPTQMPKSSGAPQQNTFGICVPHEFEAVYVKGGYAVPSGALGVSPTEIYFADYGNPSVVLSPSKTTGVWSAPTNSCTDFS